MYCDRRLGPGVYALTEAGRRRIPVCVASSEMGSTTSTTVSDPAAEQDRRYRRVRIAAAVAGVVSLVLGFVLLYAAAFMACGLAGCTP